MRVVQFQVIQDEVGMTTVILMEDGRIFEKTFLSDWKLVKLPEHPTELPDKYSLGPPPKKR